MSHEIRTPMNGILGFADLLKKPHLTGDKQEQYIKIIRKSSERMLNTINDIIDISRIEAGQIEVVKTETYVNMILDEQYNIFNTEARPKELELICKPSLSDSETSIVTDKHKLEKILSNLIENAIKFTHQGNVTFGCSLITDKNFKKLEFYVIDTGIGIPQSRIKAVFNPFEQADIEDTRAFEGSGLGLAISKSYVEMLGGKIWVESEEGIGSQFYFTLPLYSKNTEI
jgi:signal transduction histidine kinase